MISDDLRVMALATKAETTVSVAVTDTAFIPLSTNRLALVISAPSTNRVTLSFLGAAVLDAGITLYPGGPPLILTKALHGTLINGPIRAIAATGAQNMTFWESLGTFG